MYKQLILIQALLLSYWCLPAQLTLKVTAIPANTPAGSSIYIAGTMNNWNPGNNAYKLTNVGNGQYSITLNVPAGQVKFKFTRGSWATVEGTASGNFIPDRTYNYTGQPVTVNLTIAGWEDLSNNGNNSTAAANVQIMDEDFYMPQLNRFRKVWIYLPPDYNSSSKSYPVLYMHDGQNLFDNATSFAGEWKVDETLNALHQQGDYGCIVVGIDNGGAERLNEYSPWVNPQYGGGQGDEYTEFIVSTLKPYIDQHYRTLSGRNTTGIMGSSMGGLISMYAFSAHQATFSKAGIFSSAFWFAGNNPANHTAAHPKAGDARVYFLAGGQEPQYVEDDMLEVANAMITAGFSLSEKKTVVKQEGEHAEWFWAQEFGTAYTWLFANTVSAKGPEAEPLQVWPNPTNSKISISGLLKNEPVTVQIFSGENRLCSTYIYNPDTALDVSSLPRGFYLLKIEENGGAVKLARFLRL